MNDGTRGWSDKIETRLINTLCILILTIKGKYREYEKNASEKRMEPIEKLVKTYRVPLI